MKDKAISFDEVEAKGFPFLVSKEVFQRAELGRQIDALKDVQHQIGAKPFLAFSSLKPEARKVFQELISKSAGNPNRDFDKANLLLTPSVTFHCEVDGKSFDMMVDLVFLHPDMLYESEALQEPLDDPFRRPVPQNKVSSEGFVVVKLWDGTASHLDNAAVSQLVSQLEDERKKLTSQRISLESQLAQKVSSMYGKNLLADVEKGNRLDFKDLPPEMKDYMSRMAGMKFGKLGARDPGFWDKVTIQSASTGLYVGTGFKIPNPAYNPSDPNGPPQFLHEYQVSSLGG